jgi:membrane protein implicated in regulation of membrane protease activity
MIVLWVLLTVGFLAVEAGSTAFFALFFAIGCAVGAIAAALDAPIWLQLVLAALAAGLGVVVVRPLLVGRVGIGHAPAIEGVSGLVGQEAITIDEVGDQHHPGHALLKGEQWLAVADGYDALPPNTCVTVTGVRGTTLLVRPDAATIIARFDRAGGGNP